MRPTMAEMLPVPIGLPGSISPHDQALDQARAFAAAEKAKHTVGVYRRGFLAFTEWCAANQACALPATIETTAAHLFVVVMWTLCLRKMRPTMAETLPVPIGLPGSISPHDQAHDQARAFAAAEKAKHTVGVYRRGFLAFTEWCAATKRAPFRLPSRPRQHIFSWWL